MTYNVTIDGELMGHGFTLDQVKEFFDIYTEANHFEIEQDDKDEEQS